MMNEREILILQIKQWTGEWEDITRQVQWFDAQKNACRIKYVGMQPSIGKVIRIYNL